MDLSRLERLADLGFQIVALPNAGRHLALERDGFAALVSMKGEEFGEDGAPGLLTEGGFAALVWRGENAWFVARGFERPATGEEVDAIRRFGEDVKSALKR